MSDERVRSAFELESWSKKELTNEQSEQFEVKAVGESFYTMRTTFSLKCLKCDHVLHGGTNNPSAHIDMHKCKASENGS